MNVSYVNQVMILMLKEFVNNQKFQNVKKVKIIIKILGLKMN